MECYVLLRLKNELCDVDNLDSYDMIATGDFDYCEELMFSLVEDEVQELFEEDIYNYEDLEIEKQILEKISEIEAIYTIISCDKAGVTNLLGEIDEED
jgi:hypothetical protein